VFLDLDFFTIVNIHLHLVMAQLSAEDAASARQRVKPELNFAINSFLKCRLGASGPARHVTAFARVEFHGAGRR
jgi:hypothetical protein